MHTVFLIFAKYVIAVVALAGFLYWLRVRREEKVRLIVFGVIAGILTVLLVKIGGILYYDPRPFVSHSVVPLYPHGADNGFPSDHTALAAFIALTIFSSSKKWGTALVLLAVLIGASRVIGHIHSPLDIIGSLVFAGLAAFVSSRLTPIAMKKITSILG